MDQVALEILPRDPSEEEFRRALSNGFILCNILNKVNPGAVPKVVFKIVYHELLLLFSLELD